jgi:hypothetical protein
VSTRGGLPPSNKFRLRVTPRVFNIDIETCERCAGQVKIIVEASNRCIEGPAVIERILAHLKGKEPSVGAALLPENRAPPPQARLSMKFTACPRSLSIHRVTTLGAIIYDSL